ALFRGAGEDMAPAVAGADGEMFAVRRKRRGANFAGGELVRMTQRPAVIFGRENLDGVVGRAGGERAVLGDDDGVDPALVAGDDAGGVGFPDVPHTPPTLKKAPEEPSPPPGAPTT